MAKRLQRNSMHSNEFESFDFEIHKISNQIFPSKVGIFFSLLKYLKTVVWVCNIHTTLLWLVKLDNFLVCCSLINYTDYDGQFRIFFFPFNSMVFFSVDFKVDLLYSKEKKKSRICHSHSSFQTSVVLLFPLSVIEARLTISNLYRKDLIANYKIRH